jgi:hypothetical protein
MDSHRHYRIYVYAAVLLSFMILMGLIGACSGGNGIPVAPDVTEPQEPGIMVDDTDRSGNSRWGYFSGHANIEERIFEIEPMRAAGMHLNLVPTADQLNLIDVNVRWNQSNLSQGEITVDITLNNPFSTQPRYPGFDVRGIFISGASKEVAGGLWTAGDAHPRLLNPDGYTRWWNPVEFTDPGDMGYSDGKLGSPNIGGGFDAEINTYKIFADALVTPDMDPAFLNVPGLNSYNGRGVFHTASNTRRYELKFPPGDSYFNYAIDGSWAPPTASPPEVPDDFPPGANCREAWLVTCDVVQNTLEYNTSSGDSGGNLVLDVTIHDWQGKISGTASTEISGVNIYCRPLFGSQVGHGTLANDTGDTACYSANLTLLCDPQYVGTYTLGIEVISANGTYKQSTFAAPEEAPASYALLDIDVVEAAPSTLNKTFGIKAWVLRTTAGTDPCISDAEIDADIAYANAFWSQYGFGIELAERNFIDSDLYYNFSTSDTNNLYDLAHDTSGLVNLYYVNSIVGQGGAYAMIPCLLEHCNGLYSTIIFDANDNIGLDEVLTHELGHAIGMLDDEYLLDSGYTCDDLTYMYCSGVSDVYCHPDLAVWGNMMYFIDGNPDTPVSFYNISDTDIGMSTPSIDSQGEHVTYFHDNYPLNFRDMETS